MTTEKNTTLCVDGLCCATEQAVIEKKLQQYSGIQAYRFNLVSKKLFLTHSEETETIINALKEAGFPSRVESQHNTQTKEPPILKNPTAIYTIFSSLFALAGFTTNGNVSVAFFLLSILVGGWKIYFKAFKSLQLFALDMNVLMSAATLGAVAIQKYEEAAAVIVLFSVSLLLEEFSMARTRKAISSLLSLSPQTASLKKNNGEEILIPAESIAIGDVIVVRPGEKIPIDGVVTSGNSTINQSAITGESIPIEKQIGDLVFAGTMNNRGSLEIRATKTANDTTLAHIIHLVEEAQTQKSPTQSFVEKFAKIYTPAVFAAAIIIALVPPLLFSQAFGDWFYRSLVLLVIACPCALVVSTPVTIVSALTAAAKKGILIKGGKILEEAAKISAVAFDKTGTLTHGAPVVTDILSLNGMSEKEILTIAAVAERRSEHPLAEAIVSKAKELQADREISTNNFTAIPGRGVEIEIENKKYFLGSTQLMKEKNLFTEKVQHTIQQIESAGKTVIILSTETEALGIIAATDTVREKAKQTITHLHSAGIKNTVIISGDNSVVVQRISKEVGVQEAYGELLPQQKLDVVKTLRTKYGSVAMIGDGINDAPALAAANIGIAMGKTGTDVAIEHADIVLMNDDIAKIPTLFALSKKAVSILKQNIFFSLAVKAIFLLLAATGTATLWMAIFADDGVTLLVIANSLRLLRSTEPFA